MDFKTLVFLVVVGLVILILAVFIVPPFQSLRNKTFGMKFRRKTKRDKDRKLLDGMDQPLRFINQYRSFPDTPVEKIRDTLYEVMEKAKQIKSKDYQKLKEDILTYCEKADELHVNMHAKEIIDLLLKNGAYELLQKIRDSLASKKTFEEKSK